SGTTTANNIRNIVDVKVLGADVTGAVCSTAGQIAQVLVSVVAAIAGLPDGEGTEIAWTALQKAVLKEVTTQAAKGALVSGVISVLREQLTNIIEDKVITPTVLSGPLGGNLLAYGARELGNTGARSLGGAALAGTDTTVLSQADEQEYDQEFQSQNLATRLFDVYDSRSAISGLIDNTSTSPLQNVAKIGGLFTHFGSIFS